MNRVDKLNFTHCTPHLGSSLCFALFVLLPVTRRVETYLEVRFVSNYLTKHNTHIITHIITLLLEEG